MQVASSCSFGAVYLFWRPSYLYVCVVKGIRCSVKVCPHPHQQQLSTNYSLFGIVVKVNQPAQSILPLAYKQHSNWSRLGWPPAPHSANISYLTHRPQWQKPLLVTNCTLFGIVVKVNSTGSDYHLERRQHHNLVCVLSRTNLGLPPAPHWATISYLTPSTLASNAASDQLYFVWDSSKGKFNRLRPSSRLRTLLQLRICPEQDQLGLAASTSHWATILPHWHQTLLVTNYTSFGIVAKVNQPAQTDHVSRSDNSATSYVSS